MLLAFDLASVCCSCCIEHQGQQTDIAAKARSLRISSNHSGFAMQWQHVMYCCVLLTLCSAVLCRVVPCCAAYGYLIQPDSTTSYDEMALGSYTSINAFLNSSQLCAAADAVITMPFQVILSSWWMHQAYYLCSEPSAVLMHATLYHLP